MYSRRPEKVSDAGGASDRLNSACTTAGFGAMGEVPHEHRAWNAQEGGGNQSKRE
jgi:hypothetical protein